MGPLYLDEAALAVLGYSAPDSANHQGLLQKCIHADDRAVFDAQLEAHLAGRTPMLNCEFRLHTKGGLYRWFEIHGKIVRADRRGAAIELAYAVRDIHAAREQREELLASHKQLQAIVQSEERLRIALEAGHLYAFEWDISTDVVERPRQSAAILEDPDDSHPHTKQELLARIAPEDRDNYLTVIHSLTPEAAGYKVAFRLVQRDGHMAWFEESGKAIFAPDGTLRKVVGTTSDVTEVRQSERVLRELSGRLISSQEEERRRIARELHDHIGQELALICVQAQRIDSGAAEEEHTVRSDVHELYRKIKALSGDVSKLSHRLHSSELSFIGLAVAAERLCRDFGSQYNVDVDYQSKSLPPSIDSAKSLCFYRVLQEALQNVMKHSQATQVSVDLRAKNNELILVVNDNGRGFDVDNTGFDAGLGLLSMRERLNLVRGRFVISSKPGAGTRLTATVML